MSEGIRSERSVSNVVVAPGKGVYRSDGSQVCVGDWPCRLGTSLVSGARQGFVLGWMALVGVLGTGGQLCVLG
jgi:hypothetical protein